MADDDIAETFMAMPVFKWVKSEDKNGFMYHEGRPMRNMPTTMKLQQAWKGNKGSVEWKDVQIEL